MPFVTETIWQSLPHEGETIVNADWPTVNSEYMFDESKQCSNLLKSLNLFVNQELK